MKQRHFIIINIMFAALVLFSVGVVYQFMTGTKLWDVVAQWNKQSSQKMIATNQCSNKKAIANLAASKERSLQKLAVYQHVCHSFATDTMMLFFSMPVSVTDAKNYAEEDAKVLKEFAKYNIRPLVIAEPTTKSGTNIDFEQFAKGAYNESVRTYFAELKKAGLTDKNLGIWNPFPEANLPYWNNNHPEFFAPAVNNYLGAARAEFPKLATSILLNSATYEATDFNWENGDYSSLLPYVGKIKPGLIDYAGIQGFPWIARKGGAATIFNAAEFLNPPLLTEMADSLKTKNIWFNTGTFSAKYTLDPDEVRNISPSRRKEILLTIKEQATLLEKKKYNVAINIFAEDKSDQVEETNWSYWKANEPFSSPNAPVLTEFMRSLEAEKISFWLFDR